MGPEDEEREEQSSDFNQLEVYENRVEEAITTIPEDTYDDSNDDTSGGD